MSQRFYFPIIGLFFLAAACDGFSLGDYDPRREMVVEETSVVIKLSSADTVNAPMGMYRALLYDEAGERSGESFVSLPEGNMSIPVGRSTILFHTFGTESARMRNDLHLDSAAVSLPLASSQRALYDAALGRPSARNEAGRDSAEIRAERLALAEYPVVWEPDVMWLASATVDIPRRIVGEEEYVVSAKLSHLVTETTVYLGGVDGLTNLSSVSAYICGVGSAVDARTGEVCKPSASQFSMFQNEGGLIGRFRSFGAVEGVSLKLLVVLTDVASGLWLYAYDLEDDVLEETMTLSSNMDIPAPEVKPAGGFLPVIDDWNSQTIPVNL